MKQITELALKQCGIRSNSNLYLELLHSNKTRFVRQYKYNGLKARINRGTEIEKVLKFVGIDYEIGNDAVRGGKLGFKYVYK